MYKTDCSRDLDSEVDIDFCYGHPYRLQMNINVTVEILWKFCVLCFSILII